MPKHYTIIDAIEYGMKSRYHVADVDYRVYTGLPLGVIPHFTWKRVRVYSIGFVC